MIITVSGLKFSGALPKSEKCGNAISVIADTSAKKRMVVNGLIKTSANRGVSQSLQVYTNFVIPPFLNLLIVAYTTLD